MDADKKEDIFVLMARLKHADREKLAAMPPGEAQAAVDSLLQPKSWSVVCPGQLAWPGDLAADEDD